jgi:hypothetical protein
VERPGASTSDAVRDAAAFGERTKRGKTLLILSEWPDCEVNSISPAVWSRFYSQYGYLLRAEPGNGGEQ